MVHRRRGCGRPMLGLHLPLPQRRCRAWTEQGRWAAFTGCAADSWAIRAWQANRSPVPLTGKLALLRPPESISMKWAPCPEPIARG